MKFLSEIRQVWRREWFITLAGISLLLIGGFLVLDRIVSARIPLTSLLITLVMCAYGMRFAARTEIGWKARLAAILLPAVLFSLSAAGFNNLPNFYYAYHPMLLTPPGTGFWFLCFFCLSFYGLFAGLAAWKTGGKIWAAILYLLLFPLLGIGISVPLCLLLPWHLPLDHYPLAYYGGFPASIPLLMIWIAILTRRRSFRKALPALGGIALFCIVAFAAAHLLTFWNARTVCDRMAAAGVGPLFDSHGRPDGTQALHEVTRIFSRWQGITIRCGADRFISAPEKEFTDEQVFSKEADQVLKAVKQLKPKSSYPTPPYAYHEYLRDAMQLVSKRATFYHLHGETEKVLPLLKEAGLPLLDVLPGCPPLPENDSLQIRLCHEWVKTILQSGPDGAEYAEEYRQFLTRFNDMDFRVSSELELQKHQLEQILSAPFERRYLDPPWYLRVFQLSHLSDTARKSLAMQPVIAKWRTESIDTRLPAGSDYAVYQRYQHGYARLMKTVDSTMLALKLHRSLHGKYPDKLEELVPTLLPELPRAPYLGHEELVYRKESDTFGLQYWHAGKMRTE